ncbi:hypothetical protein L226DRAFT_387455 [Lentinus tigrinus ALCF2SS1-7]|uniref:uncharacterized protein n=1 Tax=Lentinus tigrinus ALCF2SS1-7 TaxID=1328758 RepID=UPI001165D544|nr:hypothetical protein L226DRAFT_387455 [Lentinus tigrinus ALCF2SS1-7]
MCQCGLPAQYTRKCIPHARIHEIHSGFYGSGIRSSPPSLIIYQRHTRIWVIALVLPALVTRVEALAIHVRGDVQQCATATLELTRGTPPYEIVVIAPPEEPIVHEARQRDPSLSFEVTLAAGTEVQVAAKDDSGEAAELSFSVDSSDDDSCLNGSGDAAPSSTTTVSTSTSNSGGATSASTQSSAGSPSLSRPTSPATSNTSTSEQASLSSMPSLTGAPKSSLSTAAIAGISATVAAISVAVLGIFCWRYMRRRAQSGRSFDLPVYRRDAAQPYNAPFSRSSGTSTKALMRQQVTSTSTGCAIDDDLLSRSPVIPASRPELSPATILDIHAHELDSIAAQPAISEFVAASPLSAEAPGIADRAVSIEKQLASPGVPSDPTARNVVFIASRPSSSDASRVPHTARDNISAEGEGRILYELDGGVRLAGGPPDMVDDDDDTSFQASLTLPPPYRRY